MGDGDAEVACPAWTTKTPKAAQPNLNYIGIRLKIIILHFPNWPLTLTQRPRSNTRGAAPPTATSTASAWSSSPASTGATVSSRPATARQTSSNWRVRSGVARPAISEGERIFLSFQLSEHVNSVLCQIPIGLQEVVFLMVNQDTRHRPQARTLVQISYFG